VASDAMVIMEHEPVYRMPFKVAAIPIDGTHENGCNLLTQCNITLKANINLFAAPVERFLVSSSQWITVCFSILFVAINGAIMNLNIQME
jgi:hypothetical protein